MSETRRTVNAHLRGHRQGITVEEARALGIDPDALRNLRRRGDLHRTRRASYVAASATPGYWARLDHAIRACQRPAFAARSAAMRLHGLAHHRARPQIELLVVGPSLPRFGDGVLVHRTRQLDPVDVTEVHGYPVTTPARTVIDMAEVLSEAHLLELADAALDDRRVDPDVLGARAAALRRGRRGLGLLVDVVADRDGQAFRSRLERATRPLLLEAGLHDVRFNVVPRHAPDAGVMDAVSEHHRAVVELDGLQWHRGMDRRQRDDTKGNAVVLGHYGLLRFTWGDVFDRPRLVVAQAAALVTHPG